MEEPGCEEAAERELGARGGAVTGAGPCRSRVWVVCGAVVVEAVLSWGLGLQRRDGPEN